MEEFTPLQWTQVRPDGKKYKGEFFAIYSKSYGAVVVAQFDDWGGGNLIMPDSGAEFFYEPDFGAWWYGPLEFPALPPEATE